ncbi:3-oxoacyl-[acyl-carrier-protein] synthase-3 [Rathayibacter agropyri]
MTSSTDTLGGSAARSVLVGLGGALPARAVTNAELAQSLDTSDEWIVSRTGIGVRHWVDAETATSDLAVVAGRLALENADVDAVNAVIVATTTPDHRCPATAPDVAARLGLGTVPAYDLSAVCSGFVYGLAQADALIRAGVAGRVLLIGADVFSTLVHPSDRTNAVIFGDGAGAAVLELGGPADQGALGPFVLGSDGTSKDLIRVRSGGSRRRDTDATDRWFAMEGRAVFAQAVAAMVSSARSALASADWTASDIDRLIGHQANRRILSVVAAALGVPAEKAVLHLDRVGNTSAASIPLALTAYASTFTPGERVCVTAFGGGTTWGSGTLTWPSLRPPITNFV